MSRYAGIKNGNIYIVSDNDLSSEDFDIVEIPQILNKFSTQELILNFKFENGIFVSKLLIKNNKDLKIAFITNWRMKCGLSTYAENLFPEIIKHFNDYKFFVENNSTIENIESDKFVYCWLRGQSLKTLIEEIKKYNPDVILINHEFGIFPNARYWLSLMTQLSEYRTIVIMHSVFHHKDKTICEAIIPEIIVHLPEAQNVLKNEKKIAGKVCIIPHGCYSSSNERLWNFYKSEHTFMQVGFGFRYKSFETSINACALLKNKYEDIYLTILFSESDFNKIEHQFYYNELIKLIENLDLQENVGIIRGFQSDNVIDSYFKTNKAAVFPYNSNPEHIVYGASGAARLAMAANIPVLTSKIPHFQDLPTIKIDTSQDIANELDNLFSNIEFYNTQVSIQSEFIEKYSWKNVALEYIKLLEGS